MQNYDSCLNMADDTTLVRPLGRAYGQKTNLVQVEIDVTEQSRGDRHGSSFTAMTPAYADATAVSGMICPSELDWQLPQQRGGQGEEARFQPRGVRLHPLVRLLRRQHRLDLVEGRPVGGND